MSKSICVEGGLRRPRSRRACRAVTAAFVLAVSTLPWLPGVADAHPLAPSLLELEEKSSGVFDVLWKTPLFRAAGARLVPVLPDHCVVVTPPHEEADSQAVSTRWRIDCGTADLVGSSLGVEGLDGSRTVALVRIELRDGRRLGALLRAESPRYLVQPIESRAELALQYGSLGFEHIVTGLDHLLFVLGLLFLIDGRHRLILAISAFTVGHSITLALASLDLLSVPSGPVEVGIALSLLVVALELCREGREGAPAGENSVLRRRPWSVSFVFGLLHGLGFAGALREAGLPSGEIPTALLCFNVGIELGQLVFIFIVLALMAPFRGRYQALTWARKIPAYAIGSLAFFWILERSESVIR